MSNFSELKKRNLLSNESMSNVRGGDSGTCGYSSSSGVECHVSKDEALRGAGSDGHWCCDSCATSTYCNAYSIAERIFNEHPILPETPSWIIVLS